jgi:Arc/MetJ-type ribon-helix-helix transcriptional regulator
MDTTLVVRLKMSLHISGEQESFLQQQVELGLFVTKEAALDAAIELLKKSVSLRAHIDRGIAQLDAGDYVEFNEESLNGFFGELLSTAKESGAS